ncbi:MAG: hypothetical protein KDB07_03005 [Planctomycetes bacterium]|nr:hypothetical protein [Planctomycetota bacterium]
MKKQPEPGTPLESVYALLFQMRQDIQFLAQFLQARAILDAPLQTVEGVQVGDELKNIVEEFINAMYPFQRADMKKEIHEMAEILQKFVEQVHSIQVELLPDPGKLMQEARRRRKGQEQHKQVNMQLAQMIRRQL